MSSQRWVLIFSICILPGGIIACDKTQTGETETLPQLFCDDFQVGNANSWQPNIPENWRIVQIGDDNYVYNLTKPGTNGSIRKPTSYSILQSYDVGSFEMTVSVKCLTDSSVQNRDMCLIFGFQNDTQFYYAHFAARSNDVHNIIGLVNNADRVKINVEPVGSSAARLTGSDWYQLKVIRDADSGRIEAYIDDMETPVLTATNKTFLHGMVGLGSFDDTGYFDDFVLSGELHTSEIDQNDSIPIQFSFKQNDSW